MDDIDGVKRKFFIFNKCCTYWIGGTWEHCCCKHDKCYDKAFIKRLLCDIKFKNCVKISSWLGKILATPMYQMVRKFGEKRYNQKQIIAKARRSR